MKLRQLALVALADTPAAAALVSALELAGFEVARSHRVADTVVRTRSLLPDLLLVESALADELVAALGDEERPPRLVVLAVDADHRGEPVYTIAQPDGQAPPLDARATARRLLALARPKSSRLGEEVFEVGALRVDVGAHRAFVARREVALTSLEFRLLSTLLATPGRVLSREQLLRDVWGVSARSDTRTIDTHLKRLRRKLGEARDSLETVRNVGYRIRADQAPRAPSEQVGSQGDSGMR